MTHEERSNIVSIITGFLVIGYLILKLLGMNAEGAFDGPDAVKIWARTVLWVIPFSIAGMIIVLIGFNIFYAIVTNTKNPSFIVDERDKHINTWGARVTMVIMAGGFILALLALAFRDWSAFAALNLVFFSFSAADMLGNITKLIMWRRGM